MITWTKLRSGEWGVRGDIDEIAPGAEVTVTKRSGETQVVTVGVVVWESVNEGVALATVAPREQQAAPAAAVDVPAGRYAVSLGGRNEVEFFKVDKPTDGDWAGWTFVKQQAGPDWHPVKGARKAAVLAAIASDPTGALLAYGLELGHCGRCGIELTDDVSREMGIGPDCAAHLGIPRPAARRPASRRVSAPEPHAAPQATPGQGAFVAPTASQLQELPGTTWEDIFKNG